MADPPSRQSCVPADAPAYVSVRDRVGLIEKLMREGSWTPSSSRELTAALAEAWKVGHAAVQRYAAEASRRITPPTSAEALASCDALLDWGLELVPNSNDPAAAVAKLVTVRARIFGLGRAPSPASSPQASGAGADATPFGFTEDPPTK